MISRNAFLTEPDILKAEFARLTGVTAPVSLSDRAVVISRWEKEKEKAVKLINKKVPVECADHIYLRYVKKWHGNAYNGRLSSFNWLRGEIAKLTSALQFFPVPLYKLKTIKQRKTQAKICADTCNQILIDCTTGVNIGLFPTESKMLGYADLWKFTPTPPTARLIQEDNESEEDFKHRQKQLLAMGRIERLRTVKWWEAKIERSYTQFCEHSRIISGKTRLGVSKYISETAKKEFISRKKAGESFLKNMVARNTETNEEIPMIDIVAGSVANPEIRRQELMVRMRGFEDVAEENKLMGGFFTITAPSKYHAFSVVKRGKKTTSINNKNYEGANPAQTQSYLCKQWQKARAKLKRLDVPLMGFRVAEPHHDGTPHWHALFFFSDQHEQIIIDVMREYFLAEDREELKNDETPRFDYKRIDKKRGTATGYIAKYIAKNIDGYQLEDNEKGEALAACAWASLWGIRQFQQIGGAPVGVWRELRRLPSTNIKDETKTEEEQKQTKSFIELKEEKHPLELARYCADIGNWSMYLEAMGGIFCPRSLMPVSLTYKEIENGYGEIVNKTNGVVSLGLEKITRDGEWQIVKRTKQQGEDAVRKRQFSPWSSVNNCTRSDKLTIKNGVEDERKPDKSG